MKDLVGQLIAGKYRVTQRIGGGGVADVFEAIHERLQSLEDAMYAALDSIADRAGKREAREVVTSVLSTLAANLVWHGTGATEEEFASAARRCFQRVAQAHAHCKRGERVQQAHTARREDLN
jgi:hypothetical protein